MNFNAVLACIHDTSIRNERRNRSAVLNVEATKQLTLNQAWPMNYKIPSDGGEIVAMIIKVMKEKKKMKWKLIDNHDCCYYWTDP